jgi:cardiolipin synthase
MQAVPPPPRDPDPTALASDAVPSVRLPQGALGRLSSRFQGGHRVRLFSGGDELFPAMEQALAAARAEVWLATYIFCDDPAGRRMADTLIATAARGVQVSVVVDGFGSNGRIAVLRRWFAGSGVRLEVFRPFERWWAWLQPAQLRRMHQKLFAVDGAQAFVGGINVIDDRFDIQHGWSEAPRLDFAIGVEGPAAQDVQHLAQALWTRAMVARRGWREEAQLLARSAEPVQSALQLMRDLRARPQGEGRRVQRALGWLRDVVVGPRGAGRAEALRALADLPPVRAALVVRDNFTQRRAIERAYVEAIVGARERIDIACSYFYPGRLFRRALRRAAERGVRVRLLMQGRIDYRIAGLAARVLYDELLASGVAIHEYTPAFLHAKVAVVDGHWVTVGSSNIDPLSLLQNLEANVVVLDPEVAAELQARLDAAFGASAQVTSPRLRPGLRGWASRRLVAGMAHLYLRLAGIAGRY